MSIANRRMKRCGGMKRVCTAMAACAVTLFAAASSYAAETGYGPAWEIENGKSVSQEEQQTLQQTPQQTPPTAYNGDVNTLKTAAETDKLIVVVGHPSDPAKSVLTYYEKDADGKLQTVFSTEAVSGMNGISTDKKEGDMKTPQGVYSFTMAFGIKDDPGSILPYHKVKDGDQYVDDGASRYYNRMVNEYEVAKDWNSSENLIRQAPHYNYALVLNYNENCVPGRGSAIFLHCPKSSNNTGTSGCISIPEERMIKVLKKVDQNTKIIVVPEEAQLAGY